ncbi:DUF7350 domain-containing protein [Halosegnis marinus]|uniref:DUF7350 domain-containing protein n=2 Tax=Halosegnis marinus TaxID=3034023 RepID=A0ABD5ZPJ9_9EURY|nr:hypothetical protein [Halosegnis sp. DT85]
MRRRRFLAAAGGAAAAGLAGCTGLVTTEPAGAPPVLSDRPDAVYFPTHVEGMAMAGTGRDGDYRFALFYSYPHRFWNVNGRDVSLTDIASGDDVHLMASVWDAETMQVLPDTGLSLEIERDGDLVSQEVIYPMLSQPMGFHYGANFGLEGDGSYDVTASVGGVSTRRTGGYEGRFADPGSATVSFDYSRGARDDIPYEITPDRAGERAAVEPMEMSMGGMSMPMGFARPAAELPGVVGEATSGDARFVVGTLDAPPAGVEGEGTYLYVSARTPYNRMVIPAMAVEAATAGFDGDLTATLDPELGYHYGAVVGGVGSEVEVRPTLPPQTARHEGYETAFMQFEPMVVSP